MLERDRAWIPSDLSQSSGAKQNELRSNLQGPGVEVTGHYTCAVSGTTRYCTSRKANIISQRAVEETQVISGAYLIFILIGTINIGRMNK